MKFKLDFTFPALQPSINHTDLIVLLGSCFTEHIHKKLLDYKFRSVCNPNGIIFNPISIANNLQNAISNKAICEEDLLQINDLWYSWNFHSSYFALGKEELLALMLQQQSLLHNKIKNAQWLILTFGSAVVYELKATKRLVANCHKVPQQQFTKRLLSLEEINTTYQLLFAELKRLNPSLQILFTVSPVRHLRDGLLTNTQSKALLQHSIHQWVEAYDFVHYFPAYEIVLDELRDYRFYEQDFAHPNSLAIQYVWERFIAYAFLEKLQLTLPKIEEIQKALQHRPIHIDSNAYRKFLETYYTKVRDLTSTFPFIDFSKELAYFGKKA